MVSPQRQLWISIWNFRDVGLFKYVVISQKNCSISTRSFIHLNQKNLADEFSRSSPMRPDPAVSKRTKVNVR